MSLVACKITVVGGRGFTGPLKRSLKSDDQYVGDSPPIIRSFVSISDNFLKQGAELQNFHVRA